MNRAFDEATRCALFDEPNGELEDFFFRLMNNSSVEVMHPATRYVSSLCRVLVLLESNRRHLLEAKLETAELQCRSKLLQRRQVRQ